MDTRPNPSKTVAPTKPLFAATDLRRAQSRLNPPFPPHPAPPHRANGNPAGSYVLILFVGSPALLRFPGLTGPDPASCKPVHSVCFRPNSLCGVAQVAVAPLLGWPQPATPRGALYSCLVLALCCESRGGARIPCHNKRTALLSLSSSVICVQSN